MILPIILSGSIYSIYSRNICVFASTSSMRFVSRKGKAKTRYLYKFHEFSIKLIDKFVIYLTIYEIYISSEEIITFCVNYIS